MTMPDGWQRILRELQEATTPVGQTGLTAPSVTSCTLTGTWYPVTGTFSDETDINDGFEVQGGDFTSLVCCKATFGGSGNFAVNKQCQLTIGLFINGVNLEKANTVINYVASNRTLPASRTITFLNNINDVFDIRVKSDTVTTDVTISELNALFIGLRS